MSLEVNLGLAVSQYTARCSMVAQQVEKGDLVAADASIQSITQDASNVGSMVRLGGGVSTDLFSRLGLQLNGASLSLTTAMQSLATRPTTDDGQSVSDEVLQRTRNLLAQAIAGTESLKSAMLDISV